MEEEPQPGAMETRAQAKPDQFRVEQDAEHYFEYVAMGWREPEAQDVGKVAFNMGSVVPRLTSSGPRRS